MNDFDPASLDWKTGLLAGWTYEKEVSRWFQGEFRTAHRVTRTCPTCSEIIALDVTARALQGQATNHGLALRRCKTCRRALKQGKTSPAYEERKDLRAEGDEQPAAIMQENPAELAKLRKELQAAVTERDEYSETIMRIMAENEHLRGRLAKYELPSALRAHAKNKDHLPNRMPWD
jgi:hypothetical protein